MTNIIRFFHMQDRFNNKGMAIDGECVRREQEPTGRRGQERERGSEYRS